MNKTKIVFGTGIVLAVLAIFVVSAVPAVNASTAYFVPEDSSAESGEYAYVKLYVDLVEGETLGGGQTTILFNPSIADVTSITKNCDPNADDTCFNNVGKNISYTDNGYAWSFFYYPLEWHADEEEWIKPPGNYFSGPRTIKICRFKVEAVGTPGVSQFNFGFGQKPSECPICQFSMLNGQGGHPHDNVTWINGTFTHGGEIPSETFEKELVSGWNLISLPLTNATDMTVANIIDQSLSGSYDELYKYTASTHDFVSLSSSDTMENGVGYFIHMTSGDTWTYSGSASNAMNAGLSDGLNMVGWLNCTKDIVSDEALSSIDGNYYYVARWNAATKEFETYNPVAPDGFNDFTMLERGEGYFISMKTGDTLEKEC